VAASPSRNSTPAVVVIDDEPGVQRVLGRMLQMHGFAPLLATDLPALIAITEQQHVDAVLLDLNLGGRSGLDILEWLRSQTDYIATPVMVFTGMVELTEEADAAIRRNRAHVFYKGQPLQPLMARLKRLLEDPAGES
jgi:DNA-binding response OmpR family regulator